MIEPTKDRLLNAGMELFHAQGYHATGLKDILSQSSVPKGSFYHHFKSKEDFGLNVLDIYINDGTAALVAHLADHSYAPLERISNFFTDVFAGWSKKGCREGCLLGNIGQELAEEHDTFRERIEDVLSEWVRLIAQCIDSGQQAGDIRIDIDPADTAEQLINSFQGAALRMKLVRNDAPLKQFLHLFFVTLLPAKELPAGELARVG